MSFATVPEILEEIRAGRMVVIVDDEDRENEGDLIMAAEKARPEDVNFMVREGRGLVCLPLTQAHCRQLGLKPMVERNTSPHHTNFTVSIEAAAGVTTGISAYDRAHTIRTAAALNAGPDDIVQPGHIFPLAAQPGGVLARAGHTEAAVDLAALAGLAPAGVLAPVAEGLTFGCCGGGGVVGFGAGRGPGAASPFSSWRYVDAVNFAVNRISRLRTVGFESERFSIDTMRSFSATSPS